MTDYRDLIPVIVEREQAVLPDGCDSWGIKSVHPDLRTYGGYQWPLPGSVAKCDPAHIIANSRDACPQQQGDGLCVALSWRGMASGDISARTLLLVAYSTADVLGEDLPEGKLRASRVAVVALVDGERLLREAGAGADLADANLTDADLARADLAGANLAGAYLARAYLAGAYLVGANLTGANLAGAYLVGANLTGANLAGAYLARAQAGFWTRWPAGFDPAAKGVLS